MIDLRSDTLTKPTTAMRNFMTSVDVGDDVYGEDPTVRMLEEEAAHVLGKEAAVFTVTSTMANQVAIRAQTEPGDAILADHQAHLFRLESGAPSALSGVSVQLLPGSRGVFKGEDVEAAVGMSHRFFPTTVRPVIKLVAVENTHNFGGGKIWPLDGLAEIERVCRGLGLCMHLDGARLWHAAAATGIPERTYASFFDTVSVCFSKGLGAPMGAVLAGPAALIERARRFKHQFGGGIRQGGIVAGAALYALRHHRHRLREDHANARLLADGLAQIPEVDVEPAAVETNILVFGATTMGSAELTDRLHAAGLWVLPFGPRHVRAIPSLNHSAEHMSEAASIVRRTLADKR